MNGGDPDRIIIIMEFVGRLLFDGTRNEQMISEGVCYCTLYNEY